MDTPVMQAIFFLILLGIVCGLCWFSGWSQGIGYQPLEKWKAKSDAGLVFCRLGENYVWLNKGEVLKFFFTDRSE
jgi:hypothetical protein